MFHVGQVAVRSFMENTRRLAGEQFVAFAAQVTFHLDGHFDRFERVGF
jgi:hypothetical protein